MPNKLNAEEQAKQKLLNNINTKRKGTAKTFDHYRNRPATTQSDLDANLTK